MHIPEELNTESEAEQITQKSSQVNKFYCYLPDLKMKQKILTGQVHSKKTDPGDGKPTYFYIWYHNSYMYYTECIKPFDIRNLPCTALGLQCLWLSKISTFQNLHICRFDLIISPSCKT